MRRCVCYTAVGIAFGILLSGCATMTRPVAIGSQNDDVLLALGQGSARVLLLPPLASFETVSTEAPLPNTIYGGVEARSMMVAAAATHLAEFGIQPIDPETEPLANNASMVDLVARLGEESAVLTRAYKDKSALVPLLRDVRDISDAHFMYVQTLKVKVGSSASYDPNTGAMAQGTSSSAVKAVLISLPDAEQVWSNESMARYLPSDGKFETAVNMLYPEVPRGRTLPDSDGDGVPDVIDREPNTAPGAEVDYFGISRDDDGDGVPNGIDRHFTEPGRVVNQWGEPIDTDRDGVDDDKDRCPDTPLGREIDPFGCPIADTEIQRVFFQNGSAELMPESFPCLDAMGEALSRQSHLRLVVEGHCDDRGTEEFNDRLSEERARAVVGYLLENFPGVTSDRIQAKGFGKRVPRVNRTDEAARAQNRRVEFVVIQPETPVPAPGE